MSTQPTEQPTERDPIALARANWERAGWGAVADGMVAVTSVMRAHQILLARVEAALERATEVAGGKDVRIGGGVSVVRQYLQAGLLDELRLAVSPVLLGQGENLSAGLDLPALGFVCTESVPGTNATHVPVLRRPT